MTLKYNPLLPVGLDDTGSGGSSTTPGGSNTQVQYNDSGAFGGDSNFTWNKGTVPSPPTTVTSSLDLTGSGYTQAGLSYAYTVYSYNNSVYSATGTSTSKTDTILNPSGGTQSMNYGGSGFTDNSTTNYRIFSTAKSHTEESTGYITVAGNGAVPSPTDGTPTINYGSGNYTANGDTITYQIYATYNGGAEFSPSYFQTTPVTDDGSTNPYYIDLAWTAVSGATGYRILRDINSGGFSYYADVATNSFSDDNTAWASGSTVTPAADYSQVIDWTKGTGITEQRVYRDTGSGYNEYQDLGNVSTFTDTNSGWSAGSPTGSGLTYNVGLTYTNMSVTSYRILKTSTGEYQDTASTSLTDDSTGWSSGSTVTPNTIDALTVARRAYFSSFTGLGGSPDENVNLTVGAPSSSKYQMVLKSGTLPTTVKNGALEYDGTYFYTSAGGDRTKLINAYGGGNLGTNKLVVGYDNHTVRTSTGWSQDPTNYTLVGFLSQDNVGLKIQSGYSGMTNKWIELKDVFNNSVWYIDFGGGMVVNDKGNDSDTRIEGDTDQNLIFVDASADFVGIGTSSPNSKLHVNGSLSVAYVAKTANYTATSSDSVINCTSGTFTVTLPTAVGITGRKYTIKNSGTGVITIGTTSSQTIDGVTTQTLGTQYMSMDVVSNGANWIIV